MYIYIYNCILTFSQKVLRAVPQVVPFPFPPLGRLPLYQPPEILNKIYILNTYIYNSY